MPEVTRKRTGELLRTLFAILLENPDGMQAKDALAAVRLKVKLTPYEAGDYTTGGIRVDKIMRFATVDCVKAGWLVKKKGMWSVTSEGIQAFRTYKDPEAFYREAVRLYNIWSKNRPDEAPEDPESGSERGLKAVSITFEEAEEQAWTEIEEYLRSINPYEFQEMVAALLRAMGYHVSWIAPPGKDGGIDILAWSDPLGTRPPRIKVQVKRAKDNIDVDGLRSFMAVLGEGDVGLFVTTGGFTKNAQDEARTQATRKVTLLDLERLFDLWVEHYDSLDDKARLMLPLRPIHFLAPES